MKKLPFFIILFLFYCPYIIIAQNNNENPMLNNAGLTYDSVMWILNQKNISFETKYKVVKKDIVTLDPLDKTTKIFIKTLSLAKEIGAGQEIFVLYNSIANNYSLVRNNERMKLFLDSASLYKDKAKDMGSLGVHYYLLGTYYIIIEDFVKGHQNYYKAIEYLEKAGGREKLIISIYYNMCLDYFRVGDNESVKEIIAKMNMVNKKHVSFESELLTNQIISSYYNDLYSRDENPDMLDSTKFYSKKSIDLFESLGEVEQSIAKAHIVYDYNNYIDHELKSKNTNKRLIDNYMYKLEQLIEPADTNRLVWYHCTQGKLLIDKKMYGKAEKKFLKSLYLKDNQKIGRELTQYLEIYEELTNIYKITGDLAKAVEYMALKYEISKKIYEESKYETIKEMDKKYETAQKDLKISQLDKEKQEVVFQRTLIVSIALFITIMLFVAFLYNRIKRLKKEKETVLLLNRIKEKDTEFQIAINKQELNAMQSYLNGLETERERLAKELHDNVANELLGIDMQLKATNQIPDKITVQLENLHTEIRNISHELMPPLFKYASLPEIISDYVSKLEDRNNIQIEVDIENEYVLENIPDKYSLEIYRIIQEATSNIFKHSKATFAKISLKYIDNVLYLTIADNGKGFDLSQIHKGIGLQIIRDRIKGLNGKININTEYNQGCSLDIQLPIIQ